MGTIASDDRDRARATLEHIWRQVGNAIRESCRWSRQSPDATLQAVRRVLREPEGDMEAFLMGVFEAVRG